MYLLTIVILYSRGSFLAMNKGGTMKSLFIPTQGVLFACGEKDFFIFNMGGITK